MAPKMQVKVLLKLMEFRTSNLHALIYLSAVAIQNAHLKISIAKNTSVQ